MAIEKLDDVRLNVKPVFMSFYHEYVFEGPCRFGKDEELTEQYDKMMAEEKYKKWYAELQAAMPENVVNLLEPSHIQTNESLILKNDKINQIFADGPSSDEVDLYFCAMGGRAFDIITEIARLTDKPWAMVQSCCYTMTSSAQLKARGIEFYPFEAWQDATSYMTVLRAKKALAQARILCAVRKDSQVSFSATDSIIDPDTTMSQVFGSRIRTVSVHELLDQKSYGDPMQNHCTPGRKGLNFTEEDAVEIDRMTRELIDGAVECRMEEDAVKKSVEMRYAILKFLNEYDCNCFTSPCPDICATRRMNEEQCTMCLNHALNNEEGIPSACEYDLAAVISKVMLQAIGRRPSYMGNTFTAPKRDGVRTAFPRMTFFDQDDIDNKMEIMDGVDNLVLTFHSVPNRRWTAFDAPIRPYAIGPFAHSGWGATIRYRFDDDKGQVITMCRIDPTCKKLFVAKGTIVAGLGYNAVNCSEGVFFEVADDLDFFEKQAECGNHVPLIYGDFEDQVIKLGKALGLEILQA